jgi:hypothetical protein
MIVLVKIGVTGIVRKGLKKNWEAVKGKGTIDSLQRQLCLEHQTQYGKYCSLILDTRAGGITAGSSTREKWPVTRYIIIIIIIIIIGPASRKFLLLAGSNTHKAKCAGALCR